MEEFLFEDSLLESMEIISFEERDIDEVLRENAHVLLECQMDLEDIMLESDNGSSGKKNIIRRMLDKIKELIKRFKNWLKSLIRKSKSKLKSKASDDKNVSDNVREYNKVIDTEYISFDVIDLDGLMKAYSDFTSTVENVIGKLASYKPEDNDIIKETINELENTPSFDSIKNHKQFMLKEFISHKNSDGSYVLQVPASYFGVSILSSMDEIESKNNQLNDSLRSIIDRTEDIVQLDLLQRCTGIVCNVAASILDTLSKVTKQESELNRNVKNYENNLRKKYNLE